MKIIVGNIKSKIQTDNKKLLSKLVDLYSFRIPGAEYSPSYRRNRWDGNKRFIGSSGAFKTGLLTRVLSDLKNIDAEPEVVYENKLKKVSKENIKEVESFTYYDYQRDLIEKSLEDSRGVIKSPTGSGKTLIMAGLIQALKGKKMVILFNAKQLLTQTYDFLTKTCRMDNIGLCYGEGYIYGDVMLCTVQSIEKILDTHLEKTKVLMVDECHEFANGRNTLAAIESFPKAQFRYGFTATPPSETIPKYNLEGALGPTLQLVNTAELIEDGTLTKPIIQLIDRPYSASGADEDMSYMEAYDEYIVNNSLRNNIIREIVNGIKEQKNRARILILTKSLNHGRALEELLGDNCQFLEGADSVGERYKSISEFRSAENPSILIGTRILQTGINIEEITHFINARGMKSEIATLQALGRALRRHDTKDKVFVYDFLDKEKYLKNHSLARKRHYEKEGHEVIVI